MAPQLSLNKRVGKRIRYVRDKKKLTQEQVAAEVSKEMKIDFHRVSLARMEKGQQRVTMDHLEAIAKALALEPYFLLMPEAQWRTYKRKHYT